MLTKHITEGKTAPMAAEQRLSLFRQRLGELISRQGERRAGFARLTGLDRSTLTQLLDAQGGRLPRAETLMAIARAGQVSVDWLLGLTQQEPRRGEMMSHALEIAAGADSPSDERLLTWHREVGGYKVRYVPARLPDLLRTEAVIRYEFKAWDKLVPKSRIELAEKRLSLLRRPEADFEMASPLDGLESFARGEGIWRDLPLADRKAQLLQMASLLDELYPRLRWYLFDGRERFSVPLTLFGPLRAAVYFGNMYVVFTATEQIRLLGEHFDNLIRAAIAQPPDVLKIIERLLAELDGRRVARKLRDPR